MARTANPKFAVAEAEPTYVRGAALSWWELAVDLGAVGLPISILGNLIATWIADAMKEAQQTPLATLSIPVPSRLKMVISRRGEPVEVVIESNDAEAIRGAVEAGLSHVNQQ